MNAPENNEMSAPAIPDPLLSLKEQVSVMRRQLVVVVVMAVVLNLSLDVYLYKQYSMVRWQRIQLQNEYQQKTAVQMHDAVKRLREFGAANPDYSRLLSQYLKVTNPPSLSAPQPASQPASSRPVLPTASPKKANP